MKSKSSIVLTLTVALLVTGSLIGAGILALPIKTGLAGFVPSLVGMVVICAAMLFTAVVLAREATESRDPDFHYATMYQKYLGAFGKWVAIFANLIVLYGLLTAYLTGATTVISKSLGLGDTSGWIMLAFFALMVALLLAGIHAVRKSNAVFMVIMWGAFALIAFLAVGFVEKGNLAYADWTFLPAAIPIVVTAFYFHNIIPSCCQVLRWDYRSVRLTLVAGIAIGLVMYTAWIYVAIGALPLSGGPDSLDYAFRHDYPATIPLAGKIDSPLFALGSLAFALFAIATSFLACGTGLLAFIRDLSVNHLHVRGRSLIVLFSFGPPLAIGLIYPDIFLKALDVVGGVGIVVLFGILPSLIAALRARRTVSRLVCLLIGLLFAGFLALEIMRESGLLRIAPGVEHWKTKSIVPQAAPPART